MKAHVPQISRVFCFLGSGLAALLALGCGSHRQSTSAAGTGGTSTTVAATTVASGPTTGATTGASTTGASTSTGMSIPPGAMCPGSLVDMPLGSHLSLEGTTVGGADHSREACATDPAALGMGNPDVVYQLKIEQRCSFFMNFSETSSWDASIGFRSTCDVDSRCYEVASQGESLGLDLMPGTYFIIIDGDGPNQAGSYFMNLQCLPPTCGDGVVNSPGEQCDEGVNPPPDSDCGVPGTPNACTLMPRQAADKCTDIPNVTVSTVNITTAATPANPLFIPATLPVFDTRVAHQDYVASCSRSKADAGPGLDQVFKFVPAQSGKLSVTIGQDLNQQTDCQPPFYDQPACWLHTMWFQSVCQAQPIAPGCKDDSSASTCTVGTDCCSGNCAAGHCSGAYALELPSAGGAAGTSGCVTSSFTSPKSAMPNMNNVVTASVDVVATQPYYLFVQGATSDPVTATMNGPYVLRATLQ